MVYLWEEKADLKFGEIKTRGIERYKQFKTETK